MRHLMGTAFKCPACQGDRLVPGRFRASMRTGAAEFVPDEVKAFTLSLTTPYVEVERGRLCLDCGHLWTAVDTAEAVGKIRTWGTKELLQRLKLPTEE